jgi:hypothetical protein
MLGPVHDPAGNLNSRKKQTLTQTFAVNSDNELTTATNSGNLVVVGTTTSQATSVTVNGTSAMLYGDATFSYLRVKRSRVLLVL